MKHFALILSILIFSLISCEKFDEGQTQPYAPTKEVLKSKKIKGGIFASGNLHRPIEIRPRDNQPCGCVYCFGICGEKWEASIEWSKFVTPLNPPKPGNPVLIGLEELDQNEVKIYIFEDIGWADSSIVVDNNVIFEVQDYGNIILLANEYDFNIQMGIFKTDNLNIPYYGFFIGKTVYD